MLISRFKMGFFVIGGAIVLFGTAVILAADDAVRLSSTHAFLLLVSLTLMIIGVYFVRGSKPCPVCGERASRSEATCKYCRHVFKNDPVTPVTHTGHSAILRRFRAIGFIKADDRSALESGAPFHALHRLLSKLTS